MDIRLLVNGDVVDDGPRRAAYASDVYVPEDYLAKFGRDLSAGIGVRLFDLDENEMHAGDLWDRISSRTSRDTRNSAPMRMTVVNRELTYDRGAFTGRYPGRFVTLEQRAELALAAE